MTFMRLGLGISGTIAVAVVLGAAACGGGGSDSEAGSTGDETGAGTGEPTGGYDDVIEPGPELAQGRYRHAAVLLADGTVFVAGGLAGPDGTELPTSVEIFRPEQGDVVPGGELLSHHNDACALRLLDGRVMIMGGFTSTTSTEIWDPATKLTELGPPLNHAVSEPMCMITDDGAVYVADSYVAGKGYLIERWQPGEAEFLALPGDTELSYGGGHDGALFGDGTRILLVGGQLVSDDVPPPPGAQGALVYDVALQVFRAVDGWDDQGTILVDANGDAIVRRTNNTDFRAARLDADSETFEDISPGGDYNLHSMASLRVDGVAILAGGFELDEEQALVATDRVLRWDPAGAQLEVVGALSEPRSHGTATRLADGRIAIIGGANGNVASTRIDVYH